ncbi:MAG: transglycosylase domain-containing protein, partial [Dermabacter sp.]|nr:transglycosylase domain-containing protein [Dermabacter sp.]
TMRALVTNATGGNMQGGSTLTQQYVKNALLMDAVQRRDDDAIKQATETTLIRKLREAKLAISLEKKWSKEEILNGYLNVAQFGPSQYGVETAAQHYFSKSAADLTPGEAALLAGITNSPNTNDPVRNPENGERRRNEVLHDMYSLGYITEEEYNQYREQPIADMLHIKNVTAGCADAGGSGFFCDYVTRSLLADPSFAPTVEERTALLYGGGLTIKTTLDPAKQALAEEILNRRVPADSSHGFGHTIVTTEPGTGKILVMAQNRSFNPHQDAGPGETSLNFNAPKHLGGGNGFPVGSTFKPFVLTEYLRTGGTIWNTVETRRETFQSFPANCLPGGRWYERSGWDPDNAVSVSLPARQTVLDATKFSVNTSYARIAQATDLCDIGSTARTMGVVPAYFNDSIEENRNLPIQDIYGQKLAPSVLALGELNIASLDMAAAYATYIADGVYCEPQSITQVLDRDGNELPITGTKCEQVLDPTVADAMAWVLKQDLEDPQATGKGRTVPGHDAGGKTGTSSSQYHTWYVGFTGQMSTAVWFGNPTSDVRPGGFAVDGQTLPRGRVWGNTVSLPTWQEYMTRASDGMENIPFPGAPERPAPPPTPPAASTTPPPASTQPPGQAPAEQDDTAGDGDEGEGDGGD